MSLSKSKIYYKRAKNVDALPAVSYVYWEADNYDDPYDGVENVTDEIIMSSKILQPNAGKFVYNFTIERPWVTSTDVVIVINLMKNFGGSIDWGDGTIDNIIGSGWDYSPYYHYFTEPGIFNIKIVINVAYSLIAIDLNFLSSFYNQVISSHNLTDFNFHNCINLERLELDYHNLSGTLPSSYFSNFPKLRALVLNNNNFSGTFPSLGNNMELAYFNVNNNGFTSFVPGDLSLNIQVFRFADNFLPTASLDAIAASIEDGIASRPGPGGELSLDGTNGNVSAAGKASMVAIKIEKPAWNLYYNE